MKIRLHLVRFMYINLILSCCFWLYDNAAAADVSSLNAATAAAAAATANTAGLKEAKASNELPLATFAPSKGAGSQKQASPNLYENSNENRIVATEEAPAEAVTVAATSTATSTAAEAEPDNVGLKLGSGPRTSANLKPATVTDTSVKIDVLPPSVNNNINDENISAVPESENNLDNINKNSNGKQQASAKVPKNQFNKIVNNNNIYTNAYQLDQLKQPNVVAEKVLSEEQQERVQQQQPESFPEVITELPTVTITELPLELDLGKDRLEAVILQEEPLEPSNNSVNERQEEPFEGEKKLVEKDELKINDPGGGLEPESVTTYDANAIVDLNVNQTETAAGDATASNETGEEVPMPVFSEWAQKQMEAEASREQAMELEQQVVNNSAQRKNATGSGSGKPSTLKLRAKNYASPDCGAKIIASNADATNTGAVLSHSSDEYMLSTCGSRIWFVVELCEAVQAQKVELANFELFSSSPKNFTVAVSKRFPTRDWSNVGRFTAEDKRTVQPFELHPHLFGKFVRVDIHTHYSKEHFCPISLFRVFGTSEYEAFETEIRRIDELDDFDDDFAGQEQAHKAAAPGNAAGANIFQSASDAVIQMVKKAAQVLVKPTKSSRLSSESLLCRTPAAGSYSCPSCNSTIVERINNLLSCQSQQLQMLLSLQQLREQLLHTRVCQSDYEISLGLSELKAQLTSGLDRRQSFFLSLLPAEQVGAMCKLLQIEYSKNVEQPTQMPEQQQTVPQQQQKQNLKQEQALENVTTAETSVETVQVPAASSLTDIPEVADTPKLELVPAELLPQTELPPTVVPAETEPTDAPTLLPTPADVNIFNVPSETTQEEPLKEVTLPDTTTSSTTTTTTTSTAATPATPVEASESETHTQTATSNQSTTANTGDASNADLLGSGNGLDDGNLANWESIDSLLTTTVASITAGGGAAAAAAAVVNGNSNLGGNAATATAGGAATAAGGINLQPKLTNGAQSESVFIRLSNRIKALERNMSLSGQYLEELSRRYKKQVEELQQTLTQQTLTVRTLEDQSRRYIEQEQLYKQQSAELAGEVRALTYQVQACILVIIIVGTCIFLMLVVGTVYYRKLRRQTQQLQPQTKTDVAKKKLSRRKSYEQLVEQLSPGKQRRPSEEAMLILNGCGDVSLLRANDVPTRQRKISICYGSNNNIANNMLSARTTLHKRKGVKHSWPQHSLDSAQLSGSEQLDKFFDVDTLKSNKLPFKAGRKKSQQTLQQLELKRQESAPANFTNGSSQLEDATQSDFDESVILDDDDLANFIPNSDLAYNEFMPEGPSGYQIVDSVDGKTQPDKTQTAKKSRRVSSPAFFKSAFGKNKNKAGSFNGVAGVKSSQSAHEATSWEWYRLRRSEKQSKHSTVPTVSASSPVSPNNSLDSTSLSEINFPFNSTQNSFRILSEAIQSSGESRPNGKSSSSNLNAVASSSSSSGASTTSSTTKKKQRAFNNLFRKVF